MEGYQLAVVLAIIVIVLGAAVTFVLFGDTFFKSQKKIEAVSLKNIYTISNNTEVITTGAVISIDTKKSIGYIESNGYVVRVIGFSNHSVSDKVSLTGTYFQSRGISVSKSEIIEKNSKLNAPENVEASFLSSKDFGKYVVLKNQSINQISSYADIISFNINSIMGVAENSGTNESSLTVASMSGYLDMLPNNEAYFRVLTPVR